MSFFLGLVRFNRLVRHQCLEHSDYGLIKMTKLTEFIGFVEILIN